MHKFIILFECWCLSGFYDKKHRKKKEIDIQESDIPDSLKIVLYHII